MHPLDSGPDYKETIMGRFPVEPWSTVSNLFFLAIVIYWSFQVYQNYRQHRFIAFSLPVLFIGYVGGTLYHATRSHEAWLLMDWVPILLLSLAVSVYYSIKQRMSWIHLATLAVVPVVTILTLRHLDHQGAIPSYLRSMISYSMMAFMVLYPIFRYLAKTNWHQAKWIILAMLSFVTAISFRSIDLLVDIDFLPMGTHWLWHSFGALAANLLLVYIYRDDLRYPGRLMD